MLVFTSCVCNYLPKARVLASSLKKFHPDWEFCLLLGEQPPKGFDLGAEPFDRLLFFDELGIPRYKSWLFRHRLVEICTAAKGPALVHFLEKEKRDKVIYLDPDIMILNSLSPLEEALDHADIILTPHQLSPQKNRKAVIDNEICSLQHGVYNLGFAGVAGRGQGLEFARFWRDRLYDFCYDDKKNGIFTDQRWCDLVPAYFDRLQIVRDPGCNAASWNLTDRKISRNEDGIFTANGMPLRFYHFTGYDSGAGKVATRYYGSTMPAVAALWEMYGKKLDEAGHEALRGSRWAGLYFDNGTEISDDMRLWYRRHPEVQSFFPDPFHTDSGGRDGYLGLYRDIKRNPVKFVVNFARKPFVLASLVKKFLSIHGGMEALPYLWKKIKSEYAAGGFGSLYEKIHDFRQNNEGSFDKPLLRKILEGKKFYAHWHDKFKKAFDGKNSVLVIDHMYGGGANAYREKRIEKFLDDGNAVLVATWDFFGKHLAGEARLPNDGGRLSFRASGLDKILNQDILRFDKILLNNIVLWSTPNLHGSHYHALPDILEIVRKIREKNGAFLEYDVNDYYAICPSWPLVNETGKYCGLPNDPARCTRCLVKGQWRVPDDFDLAAWRSAWQKIFVDAGEVRAFASAPLELLNQIFNIPAEKCKIVPHTPLGNWSEGYNIPQSGPMRIAVIGDIGRHKGADIVRELATMLKDGEKLAVIGELEGEHPGNVQVYGRYDREELPNLLRDYGITVALLPSVCPETFCYTAQECEMLGLPFVVFPLGAQAERAAKCENAFVARDMSAEAALEGLRELDKKRLESNVFSNFEPH